LHRIENDCLFRDFLMFTTSLLIGLIVLPLALLAIGLWAWWGDGRTDLRRCPNCSYDMLFVQGLRCPECGKVVKGAFRLYLPQRRMRLFRVCIAGFAILAPIGIWNAVPLPWTSKLPRVMMRKVVAMTADQPLSPAGLPTANAAYENSPSAWERLLWQHQFRLRLDACYGHVMANSGPVGDEEMVTLAPMLEEVRLAVSNLAPGEARDTWMIREFGKQLQAAYVEAQAADELSSKTVRLAWMLSTITMFHEAMSHKQLESAVLMPDSLIEQAMRHSDARVRAYGVRRFSDRVQAFAFESPTRPPDLFALLQKMAKDDPDASVRSFASVAVTYYEDVFSWW
jgi:hypothetical protein